jgi:hypothetical protein
MPISLRLAMILLNSLIRISNMKTIIEYLFKYKAEPQRRKAKYYYVI